MAIVEGIYSDSESEVDTQSQGTESGDVLMYPPSDYFGDDIDKSVDILDENPAKLFTNVINHIHTSMSVYVSDDSLYQASEAQISSAVPSPPIEQGAQSFPLSQNGKLSQDGPVDIPPALQRFFATLFMPVHAATDIFIKHGFKTEEDLDTVAMMKRDPYDTMRPFIEDLISRMEFDAWIAVEVGFLDREEALLRRGAV
jgi:hypothetical protein